MSEPRVIKKYPNRRLYDTVESRYITLADVRKLVVERIEFMVIDKKSQEDITRSILLQVIAEQEHAGEPLMSRDFLQHIIRSYGGGIMQQSLKLFAAQQREVRDKAQSFTAGDADGAVAAVTQRNFQRWRTVQDEIFRTLIGSAARTRGPEEEVAVPQP
jgi:polyhydroxyalkanoate synthesis repressor PhaR